MCKKSFTTNWYIYRVYLSSFLKGLEETHPAGCSKNKLKLKKKGVNFDYS